MKNRLRLASTLLALAAWIAAAYALRYGLMEHTAWVGACALDPGQVPCTVRAGMGQVIHWNVLPVLGLVLAMLGWLINKPLGTRLAIAGLVVATPGLVLYTTSLAGVVVMLAALRWARS